MRSLIVLFFCLGFPFLSVAQENVLDASTISSSFLPNADAIVRERRTETIVNSLSNITLKEKLVICILNASGLEHADIRIFYEGKRSKPLKSFQGALYDAHGGLLKKIRASDLEDLNAVSGYSLFEDFREKHYAPFDQTFPFTLSYEYELNVKQSFWLYPWLPQESSDIAVEKGDFTVITKKEFPLRFKEINLTTKAEVSSIDGQQIYHWQATGLTAYPKEPYALPYSRTAPQVRIALQRFDYNGYNGDVNNWQEYGKWMGENLLANRDQLPQATIMKVKQLTSDCKDTLCILKKIYEYVQSKTRYVSIQIGIGGFQPMKAAEVDQLGYGDCKGLVNYTKALLKSCGITAFYTEIAAGTGKKSLYPDFASPGQANHVILMVPIAKDTVWLECTNQEIPFGYLGNFTDDRYGVAITATGGKLIKTRRYTADENKRERKVNVTLDSSGNLSGTLETWYRGILYDSRNALLNQSAKERDKLIKEMYPINNLDVIDYSLDQQKTRNPQTHEKLKFDAFDYASKNDERIYVPLNEVDGLAEVPKGVENRKNPVYLAHSISFTDSMIYSLPENYSVEFSPPDVNIQHLMGRYTSRVKILNKTLIYTRTFDLTEGLYPAELYAGFISFEEKIFNTDGQSFILRKRR